MIELEKKQKICIGVILVVILGMISYYFVNTRQAIEDDLQDFNSTSNTILEKQEIKQIIVHVTGYVEKEGIVQLEEGARIADAIQASGGETLDADLSKINLAYKLKDGQKIYIPSVIDQEEDLEYVTAKSGNTVSEEEIEQGGESMVNINTASQTELETLTGIGPSTAEKIIEYRKQNGEFKSVEDIRNVSGIGESRYNNIKDKITV